MANQIFASAEEGTEPPLWLEKAERFAYSVMDTCGYDGQELALLFCSDKCIQHLNKAYRGKDCPTDVLSFENGETYADEEGNSWLLAGDIAISIDTLPVNAEYFEVSQNEELKRLIIHGILHLNGYDHGDEHVEKGVEPECEMLVLQKKLMEQFRDECIIGE